MAANRSAGTCALCRYTIYLSHVIEAKQLARGGSFDMDEKDFLRFKVGNGEVEPLSKPIAFALYVSAQALDARSMTILLYRR